jgi:citrate synthase
MKSEPPALTTGDVARRLGVKPATVYAYVSRGLLLSHRNADGKGSLFAEADVDAFVADRRRPAGPDTAPAIHTGITLIRDGRLSYRGRDACALATTRSYESVVMLLWTGTLEHVDLQPSAELRALAQAVTAPLPRSTRLTDRLRLIVAAAAAADPLRFDTTPAAVIATGQTMLATMVAALPIRSARQPIQPSGDEPFPLASALWPRLTAAAPTPAGLAALNAALVLLADHDIAASTLAARVAASTRAHPYAIVGAGLAALDGPLHGAASGLAYALLADAAQTDPVRAISERLRVGRTIPGFGHPLYPDGDPRAATLLGILAGLPGDGDARAVVDDVVAAMTRRPGAAPNVDFAIAALASLTDMGADAGEAIFAIARTAGWIAHALEEYADQPSRFRPSGHYSGPTPTPADPVP